jgi:hypothetical protein
VTMSGIIAAGHCRSDCHPVKAGFEVALTARAHDLLGHLAVVEHQQRWNRADAVFGGKTLLFVYVHLADFGASIVFLSEFVQHRSDHFAGTTPFGPEIHKDRSRGLENFFGEILLSQNDNVGRCHKLKRNKTTASLFRIQ